MAREYVFVDEWDVDAPQDVVYDIVADARTDPRTRVLWDWIVFADRPLLRHLTPILRPLFRWNHNWAVARAREQLEPYARARAAG